MIQFKSVRKVYPNGTVGLDNINLTIHPGEFVIIVGLSGAGKSTLLRSINRLHEISDGEILIDGKSITAAKGVDLRRIRRDIGMIFQNFNLVKRVSVIKNVLSGRVGYHSTLRTLLGLWPKRDVELALDALSRVNIREKAYARADELSGGQQQRVSIARALAQEAKIILADEPVASLNPLTTPQGNGRPEANQPRTGYHNSRQLALLGLGSRIRYSHHRLDVQVKSFLTSR